MDKIIQTLIDNYGSVGVAVASVLAILYKLNLPLKAIFTFLKWIKKPKIKHYNPKDILTSKLDYWIGFKIPNIRMDDLGREMIFKDILRLKFMEFDKFVHVSYKGANEDMDGKRLFNFIFECFTNAINSYEKEAKDLGIPPIVLEKYKEWNVRSYEFTIMATQLICMSSGYDSNLSRINAIYSLVTAMMELTIAEAEKTLTLLNGDLTGISYKNVVCG